MTAETRPKVIAFRGCIPNTDTWPEVGCDRPRMMSIVDVLPAPLGPRIATISPDAIRRSTPLTACTCPKRLCTPVRSTAGGACPLGGPMPDSVLVIVIGPVCRPQVVRAPSASHDLPMTAVMPGTRTGQLTRCSPPGTADRQLGSYRRARRDHSDDQGTCRKTGDQRARCTIMLAPPVTRRDSGQSQAE